MNKIILLEIGFNFAFIEAVNQVLQTQLIQSGLDLVMMFACSLLSRLLMTKIQTKMKGKNLINILGLVKDVALLVVDTVKQVRKKKQPKKK
ncbi:MAG: hypothetical protein ACRCXN_08905 [Bacteroidales bacterium]